MRSFLPIKGPGGRHLTPNEKAALLVLGLTLVFCLLTLLAGTSAFDPDARRNPIFAVVSALCRWMGGGVVALYALVLVWSGLIYFKGERIAQVAPVTGRLLAAMAVMVGISGALGVARLETAGALGRTVGHALQNAFGPTAAFPILFALMGLGLHLAGRGAWTALREPTPLGDGGAGLLGFVKTPTPSKTPGGYGIGLQGGIGRRTTGTPMPDDGDPTSEERSGVVARAVADIERRKGVTILEVSPSQDEEEGQTATAEEPETGVLQQESERMADSARASIGEEVDTAPAPAPDTEEADVQRRLHAIDALLGRAHARTPRAESAPDPDEEEDDAQASNAASLAPDIVAGPGRTNRYADEDDPYAEDDEEDEEDDEFVAADDDEVAADLDEDLEEDDDDFEDEDGDLEDGDLEDGDLEDGDLEDGDLEDGDLEDGDLEDGEDEVEDDDLYDDEDDEDAEELDDEEDAYEDRDHGLVPVPADDEPEPVPLSPVGRTVQAEFALPPAPEETEVLPVSEVAAPEAREEEAEAAPDAVESEDSDSSADIPATRRPGGDPYARPGLLDRLGPRHPTTAGGSSQRKTYASFDWRGRPIE